MEFSKLINFLLLMSEFNYGNIIIFAGDTIFCIKRRSSFVFLNISYGMKWGASLVPTWTITSSGFFFSRGTAKSSCLLWWHLERFALWSFFFSTFYILVSLIRLNHPLLRWCISSKWVVYCSFLVQSGRLRWW